VTKRKISGGTVSDRGRHARDIMLGLAKTCMKLKLSLYEFLDDRFHESCHNLGIHLDSSDSHIVRIPI
jgi:hypothetical protein